MLTATFRLAVKSKIGPIFLLLFHLRWRDVKEQRGSPRSRSVEDGAVSEDTSHVGKPFSGLSGNGQWLLEEFSGDWNLFPETGRQEKLTGNTVSFKFNNTEVMLSQKMTFIL